MRREIITLKKNEVIFRQGDESARMYDIYAGRVGIYADYGTEREKLLTELKEGDFFGEMGIIDNRLRSATAVALEKDTAVEVIDRESFAGYFEDKPLKVLKIMQTLSKRIRRLTEDYMDACRAVTETVEAEKTGEKSQWLKENESRYVEEYRNNYVEDIDDLREAFRSYWG